MRAVTTIVLLVTGTVSFSQHGGLKGHVLDKEQFPLAGLTLKILEGDSVVTWAITDQYGNYKLEDIKAGHYDLSIQHLGFKARIIKDVTISANEIRQFNITHPDPGSCIESEQICPKGHTDDLIPIVYGLPGKRSMKRSKKGQIRLGGCIVTDCDPKWYCKNHEIEF